MGKPSLPTLALLLSALASTLPAAAQEPNFGRAVTMTADGLFIGQPVNWYGPGTVYTYRWVGGSGWAEREMLIAPDSARMDDFGRALAAEGNTVVVGAPRKHDGSGAVYVFTRTSPTAPWSPSSWEPGATRPRRPTRWTSPLPGSPEPGRTNPH